MTYSFIAMPDRFPYVENVSYSESSFEGFGSSGHPYRMQQVLVIQRSLADFAHEKMMTSMDVEYSDDGSPSDRKQQPNGMKPFDPTVLPGDYAIFNKDGARIGLLRGGVAILGATDMCQTLYFSEENLTRRITQNDESFTDAGRSQVFNDDGKVTSRFLFSRDDKQTYTAAQNVPKDDVSDSDYPSYFPFQFDIGDAGDFLTAFIGKIVDNKRQNRAALNVTEDGVITLDLGPELHKGIKRMQLKLDPATGLEFVMYDESGENETYRKQVIYGNKRASVKEAVLGHKFVAVKKGSYHEVVDYKKEVLAIIAHTVRSLVNQRIAYAVDDASTIKTTKLKNELYPDSILGDE